MVISVSAVSRAPADLRDPPTRRLRLLTHATIAARVDFMEGVVVEKNSLKV